MKKLFFATVLSLTFGAGIAHAQFIIPNSYAPTTPAAQAQQVLNCINAKGVAASDVPTAFSQCAAQVGYTGSMSDAQTLLLQQPSHQVQPTAGTNPNIPNPNAFCAGGKCTYVPLEPLPGLPDCFGPNTTATCKNPSSNFASYIGGGTRLLIWLGAITAVVVIIMGALTYMFSDIVSNKSKAIARIRSAMWALVLLASCWLILNTINPQLVNLNLAINPFGPVAAPGTTNTGLPPSTQQQQDVQAQINACNTQYAPLGGTLHLTNGGVVCQPNGTIGSGPV